MLTYMLLGPVLPPQACWPVDYASLHHHAPQAVVNECVLPVFDLPHRTFASFDGQPEPAPESEQRQRGDAMPLSGEGLPRVERQARRQLGQLWELAAAQYATRGVSMLHAVCVHCVVLCAFACFLPCVIRRCTCSYSTARASIIALLL